MMCSGPWASVLADQNSFFGVDIARFGDSIDYILDRKTLSRMSVLSQYDRSVEMYRQYYQYEVIDGVRRRTVETIPEIAFREAMANAIVGRKWNVNAHIRVAMFADRIEIFTPGGLPEDINRDDYMNSRIPVLRNPVLGSVFYRMHYLEQLGTGIRRIQEAYENNRRKPVFNISKNAIQAILPVTGTSDLTEAQETVYGLMKTGRKISSSSASRNTGFSKSKATAILKQLAAKGYVQITGNGRGTKYEAAK